METEDEAERFLIDAGFMVINKSRYEREHGRAVLPLHIIGMDKDRRLIQFMSFSYAPNMTSVSLLSQPPTKHAAKLEEMLIEFGSTRPGCKIIQLSHSDNPADSEGFFESQAHRIENLSREVNELQRQPKK